MPKTKLFKKAFQLWWKKNRIIFAITFGLITLLVIIAVTLALHFNRTTPYSNGLIFSDLDTIVNVTKSLSMLFLFVPAVIWSIDLLFLLMRIYTGQAFTQWAGFTLVLLVAIASLYSLYDRWNFVQYTQGTFQTRLMNDIFKDTICANTLSEYAYINDKAVLRCNGMFFPSYDEVVVDRKIVETNMIKFLGK